MECRFKSCQSYQKVARDLAVGVRVDSDNSSGSTLRIQDARFHRVREFEGTTRYEFIGECEHRFINYAGSVDQEAPTTLLRYQTKRWKFPVHNVNW